MPQLPAFFTLFLLFAFLTGCAGKNFDESSIPAEQLSAEFAFRRLAQHGELEAVVEINQVLKDWQFHVSAYHQSSAMGATLTTSYTLSDRSGIEYTVSSEHTAPEVLKQLTVGTYGYGSGSFVTVERDLAAGKIFATVKLEAWRERGF